jgi:hypothetical protein
MAVEEEKLLMPGWIVALTAACAVVAWVQLALLPNSLAAIKAMDSRAFFIVARGVFFTLGTFGYGKHWYWGLKQSRRESGQDNVA